MEWYQENDGGAGDADLAIRYSTRVKGKKGHHVKVIVNGDVIKENLLLPNTRSLGSAWGTITVPFQIGRGANTIRIEPINGNGLCIDEITVR